MTFSLLVNAMIDKFGLIDPSTSTVLVGMTLGGTWGFVLDNMLGTDEGFREYLWSPERGMAYAMGCLYSHRFGRYVVTILFDMFFTVRRFFVFTFFATACLHGLSAPAPFTSSSLRLCALPSSSHLCLTPSLHTFSAPPSLLTPSLPTPTLQVILFKRLYSKLVNVAGFTVNGHEWIANGFVSAFISLLTFEVYANMTRFQWAYPSGQEQVLNQWISGCARPMGSPSPVSPQRPPHPEPGFERLDYSVSRGPDRTVR